MSRVGKLPIPVPENVRVSIENNNVTVQGPLGSLTKEISGNLLITNNSSSIVVTVVENTIQSKTMWGTARSIINNMVVGVSRGYEKHIEVVGVGYRFTLKGRFLNITLGKSHNTKVALPDYIEAEVIKQNIVILKSFNKEKLGQFTALIMKQRKPEPYKGKGIRLVGQHIIKKESKKSAK